LLENLRLETVFPLLEVFTTPGYERSHSLDFLVLNLQEMRRREDWATEMRRLPQVAVDLLDRLGPVHLP